MTAHEQRETLDALVRRIEQVVKDWPAVVPELRAALDAGWRAANVGIDVKEALAKLEAVWPETQSAPAPEPMPEPAEPSAEAAEGDF